MSQNAEKVLDHFNLFREPEYINLFESKRKEFEFMPPDQQVEEVREWAKTEEYKEKNFAREALVVNPAKACQPLGAVFAAVGFEGTIPFVHGSQGCVAYYRSHFSRHFKEPTSCVSSSMTEDAAVFGGLNNMIDGLANTYNMYKPKMIAVSTTCMAEVIGDDLNAFIKTSKEKGSIPADFDVPFAHTPAFVGSHITGYDNVMKGILQHFWDGKSGTVEPLVRQPNESINFLGGFDGYTVGNLREIKRIFNLFGIDYTIIGDNSDVWDTPTDGEFRMYDGGTTLEQAANALHAKATISMQEFCTEKTLPFIAEHGQEVVALNHPIGVKGTDRFLMEISRLTGKPIPVELEKERGRLVDAIADSTAHIHGQKFAIYGDPDLCYGLAEFLLELGAEPTHVLATNGGKAWETKMQALFDSSPFGKNCKVYPGRDLWHMRSLLFTEPVDFLIGNTYGKYLERDTGTPLIRIGFPIFDRHHKHRYPVWGYQGGLNVLVWILDRMFEAIDANTNIPAKTDYSFDIIR
ncbi:MULTISPECIES: nitrogenase molybdenum-iron protein subunit beta [Methylococcus]|jgi:nitrogenase molybdenum-iron protein beta chain|uniref:Nitrogenase molybdenum-iron protein beta chain n=1 Tax=Methylococcus capsulatus (strain ATCC 33009 / NCIMB 11132 / Bath) TaxID=243233 RepID=Q60C79_METCA|nr:nitrogenase molybdenum-iron protein subunit beta [Methylococcus capsulatus]AAU90624.1 nitrogenase molybdenum-iron protein beta chain [Methylococcus capsulatus str. Bath]QXP86285.1 nitrogenase molybdenum-iron protein subunit beta [Methylococcus capsulatus]QXP89692.1 nitrogenase molybdenum-iron protein subunit beta [Methylococcus capsulatus]QXP94044.1 nitrogenase molybdenum-iron protein subunit beta [Methylococcus capsulatus]UQN11219.1 nitrogenase molybdenum-iron protein subunit beta [Methylo